MPPQMALYRRLAACSDQWRSVALGHANSDYRLQFFVQILPPTFCAVITSTVLLASVPVLREEISFLLQNRQNEWFICWKLRTAGTVYFLVTKMDGSLSPVLDMCALNKHFRVHKFKILTD